MSSTNPEPSDVGPAVGGHLVATDLDREHVVTLVTEAQREGLLSLPERDRRIVAARAAEVFDDLVPLTRDLVGSDGTITTPAPLVQVDTATADENPDQIYAIFSGVTRKGGWRVRRTISAMAVFGGVELDLTEATFESQTITINCFCLFGGIEITVPAGVEVRSRASGIFGGVDAKAAPPVPGAPVVEITGVAGFGGIEVRNPKLKRRHRG
ncbi:MAG TPA: LiaF-related protein [Propionicimonas sp.]|nr:LiaF-related protein [Propionicimonas sp.]